MPLTLEHEDMNIFLAACDAYFRADTDLHSKVSVLPCPQCMRIIERKTC